MSTKTSVADVSESTEGYATFEHLIRDRVASAPKTLFCTDADPEKVWAAYLDNLPGNRQHYNCNCCRRFVERFGTLVTIGDDGEPTPVVWSPDMIPHVPFFAKAVEKMHDLVKRAKVTGVFLSPEATWGTPQNVAGKGSKYEGQTFEHISGTYGHPFKAHVLKNADQATAEKREDFGILQRAMEAYSEDVVKEAKRVLSGDVMYREEKALPRVEWFLKLIRAVAAAPKKYRPNVVWKFVAEAPPGFCHVTANVENTLYDDLKAELPLHEVQRKWASKLHPLKYQRPTAAPSEGALDRAEEIVAKLGIEKSFDRRFATLEEVQTKLWSLVPVAKPDGKGGFFGDLRKSKPKVKPAELPNREMTVAKFLRDMLPKALGIEVRIVGHAHQSFYGLLTNVHPEAPPIIQWDGLKDQPRNPVSWYFHGDKAKQYARNWGLAGVTWAKVNAVFFPPHEWQVQDVFTKTHGKKLFFALEGCVDQSDPQLCLFPEILGGEYVGDGLRQVKKVVEAHNATRSPIGRLAGTANGIAFSDGRSKEVTLRVETDDGFEQVTLDRWE